MSLISKEHLNITTQIIKKLLSFKADKTDLEKKIDRSEIEPSDALELVSELNLVKPIAAHDGSIYTDENGLVYIL